MHLVVDQGKVKATVQIGDSPPILSEFTTITDLIVDIGRSVGYFIADVAGREDWWLYECSLQDSFAKPIVRVVGPQLALWRDSDSFVFKIHHNREVRTVRCILGDQVKYCLLDLGLAPRLGEVVKIAEPTTNNTYINTLSAKSRIDSIQFDFTGVSLVEVARNRIRPHNKNSQVTFHSFLDILDEQINVTGSFGVQEKNQCDGIEIEVNSVEENYRGRCELLAHVLNTYGMYGSQLGVGSGFKFYSRRQSIYETSLDSEYLGPEEYSELISTTLRGIRAQGFPVFASTVSAGSIPLTLAAVKDPGLCNGLIISKGLRFPVSGQFSGKIDRTNIADYLSFTSKSILASVDIDSWYAVPTLLLSASNDSRVVPSERLESRSEHSTIFSFDYDGGHLAAPPEVEIAVEMLRVFFIKEVAG